MIFWQHLSASEYHFFCSFRITNACSKSSTNNRNNIEEVDHEFTIPTGALKQGPNVVTVVQVCILSLILSSESHS